MNEGDSFIHPTAEVSSEANIEPGVFIGPQTVIGPKVSIQENTRIDGQVHIQGMTEIGQGCHIFPFCTIGGEPQDVDYKGEKTRLQIGAHNIIREFVSIHRGSKKGGGMTSIGQGNYIMAYSHIAHDCRVGDNTVFINAASLSGHVTVDDHATVGGFTGVHQFCCIGKYAFVGGYSAITQDVLPFSRVAGNRPLLLYGLNAIGLRRAGFSRERIQTLKQIFKIFFYSNLNTTEAVKNIEKEIPKGKDRDEILRFIQASTRGIVKKPSEQWERSSG
jgi:UDP-N-acetylglucosamine acyltransferase